MVGKNGTQIAKVLKALEDGPGSAAEVSAETGMSMKFCSSYLRTLVSAGRVEKTGKVARSKECPHCGYKKPGKLAFIYGLVGQKRAG